MEVKITVQDEKSKEIQIEEYENFAHLMVDVVNKLDLDVSEVIIKKQTQERRKGNGNPNRNRHQRTQSDK